MKTSGKYLLKRLMGDFKAMFFPRTCRICHEPLVEGEQLLCLHCIREIPVTRFDTPGLNPLEHKIADPVVPIAGAASFFFYTHTSPYASLIRDAKYNNQPEIDALLARIFAEQLQPYGFFDGVDLIVPVPIHWFKRVKRGYNQGDFIAQGVSEVIGAPVADDLLRARAHAPQAKKSGRERRLSADSVFSIEPKSLPEPINRPLPAKRQPDNPNMFPEPVAAYPAHILLVDDVITTGATILRCAALLHSAFPLARLSILSLATTPL